jgi:hypothetical protein
MEMLAGDIVALCIATSESLEFRLEVFLREFSVTDKNQSFKPSSKRSSSGSYSVRNGFSCDGRWQSTHKLRTLIAI